MSIESQLLSHISIQRKVSNNMNVFVPTIYFPHFLSTKKIILTKESNCIVIRKMCQIEKKSDPGQDPGKGGMQYVFSSGHTDLNEASAVCLVTGKDLTGKRKLSSVSIENEKLTKVSQSVLRLADHLFSQIWFSVVFKREC